MKKVTSLLLVLLLLCGLTLPSQAATSEDTALNDRLKAVMLKVKDTLDISDDYTSFDGTVNETGTASIWNLNWVGPSGQLSVTANENGTIIYYSSNMQDYGGYYMNRMPRLPNLTLSDAQAVAQEFLGKVLDKATMSVELSGSTALSYYGVSAYYLYGTLKLYGIDTPVAINVNVSSADKKVISYSRSDEGSLYSSVTKPTATVDKAAAGKLLKDQLNMTLTYALRGDNKNTAALQYTSLVGGSFVVDAQTGKVVDLSKLDYSGGGYYPMPMMGSSAGSAANMGGAVVTPVEQATIDKLEGVQTMAALEKKVRGYSELGLSDAFKLTGSNYFTSDDGSGTPLMSVNLQFSATPDGGQPQYRYITLNAKTGQMMYMYSDMIVYSQTVAAGTATTQQTNNAMLVTAKSFLTKILPDAMKEAALADTVSNTESSGVHTYTFNRVHEGIAFPENSMTVGIDTSTGYVVNFFYNWYTQAITYQSPLGLITASSAADKYLDSTALGLRYVQVPQSYKEDGVMLAYTNDMSNVWGVDAATGDLLKYPTGDAVTSTLSYSDIGDLPDADMVKQLASYNIGFTGGVLKPEEALTQLEALCLIESAAGMLTPYTMIQDETMIYNNAAYMNIIKATEKDPTKKLTRAEFVKYLVNALGFGEAAAVTGIYTPGFNDDGSIPVEYIGYMALGRGVGIIKGDENGNCNATGTVTRLTALHMLFNCLNRA